VLKNILRTWLCANRNSTNNLPELFYTEDDKSVIDYFKDIFENKLKLYHYCESQLSRIAFANSIFIAALAVLIGSNNGMKLTIYTVILFIPFVVSLGITIWSAIPKILTNKKLYLDAPIDHRSVYGIAKFKCVGNLGDHGAEKYRTYIASLNIEKIYEELTTQIYKMNDTIIRDYRYIKAAVICSIIGLIVFLGYLLFVFGNTCKLVC